MKFNQLHCQLSALDVMYFPNLPTTDFGDTRGIWNQSPLSQADNLLYRFDHEDGSYQIYAGNPLHEFDELLMTVNEDNTIEYIANKFTAERQLLVKYADEFPDETETVLNYKPCRIGEYVWRLWKTAPTY